MCPFLYSSERFQILEKLFNPLVRPSSTSCGHMSWRIWNGSCIQPTWRLRATQANTATPQEPWTLWSSRAPHLLSFCQLQTRRWVSSTFSLLLLVQDLIAGTCWLFIFSFFLKWFNIVHWTKVNMRHLCFCSHLSWDELKDLKYQQLLPYIFYKSV